MYYLIALYLYTGAVVSGTFLLNNYANFLASSLKDKLITNIGNALFWPKTLYDAYSKSSQ